MDIVVIIFVLVAVSLLCWALLSFVFAEDRIVAARLEGLTEYEIGQAKAARPVLQPFTQRVLGPVAHRAARAFGALSPRGWRTSITRRLVAAGNPGGIRADTLFALKLAGGAALGGLALAASALGAIRPGWALVVIPGAAAFGFLAPDLWLGRVEARRKSSIRSDLADMLDMLTISVEAGLGFDAALAKYVKNSHGALGMEFGRVLQEVQAGASRRDAMRRLTERTQVAELRSFVTAVVQAEVLGTSIADVLRNQAREIRLRRRQHAEEQAQKMPVKMVFPVILCILPATLVVVLGPAIIRLGKLLGL